MFFSGDSSTRKRVDLGGRSSKERDRQVLLEQTRLERKKRQNLRQQISAATRIQKCFRGRKDTEKARLKVKEQFFVTYGAQCQKADQSCFGPESTFLRDLLFFVNVTNNEDNTVLLEVSNFILNYARNFGNIVNLFSGSDYLSNRAIVEHRLKKLTFVCLQAVYQNRTRWKGQLLMQSNYSSMPAIVLLETVCCLVNNDLPWASEVMRSLHTKKVFSLLRGIILEGLEDVMHPASNAGVNSSLEQVLIQISLHFTGDLCCCTIVDTSTSFYSQILSVPFLWHHFPNLKEVFCTRGLGKHCIHEMMRHLPGHIGVIVDNLGPSYPGYACVLGNLLEAASPLLSASNSSHEMALDMVNLLTLLLDMLPSLCLSSQQKVAEEDEPMEEENNKEEKPCGLNLQRAISTSMDSRLFHHLVNVLLKGISSTNTEVPPDDRELEIVGSTCAFLHVTFSTLPMERSMTGLAYRTEIVPALWSFIRRCHSSNRWPVFAKLGFSSDAPGWLLPLTVFCPVYKHMLTIIGNEEFYEQEKPLSLKDIKSLILILKQALWNLLWVIPSSHSKPPETSLGFKKLSVEKIKTRANIAIAELLAKLEDWNNRRQFTLPTDFHYHEAMNENFVSQAMLDNTRANEILTLAPFLVPFNARVRIFQSYLDASKQRSGFHQPLTNHRLKIRRSRILDDAFSQLSAFTEEDLRNPIRVVYVNELGIEEAGIDGGGIFKDFMENIVQASFDVQYGLFKETSDHLLYPNPGSGLIHDQHLQYFHFLGSLLGKAMYEGILVDIPLATFFLSKLKQKYNYLNDLPSLDAELYRHLQFLKHYEGDVSELELYFVIVNNEYGEQTEEELLPGGRDMHVTNDNVITFIHLVSNHRLNYQIRNQSSYFLKGFQQLIQKDWIDMFNEHELQLLISGSLESMDVDDLRDHATYSGGYEPGHEVIERFWEVMKSFSLENQKKFLKFVTGCSRGPLLGFKYLEPKFCIQRVGQGNVNEEVLNRLPTSATCMNLLKLPPYTSKEQMRTKLMYAINAEAGFDLS
ncbi:E3 ubiquitin-protein ligase UPL6-like isoform X1 [Carex littledalei]|uniref:HECT-type E3 ubiquitin transferase n=1 Tax=Carex littledalei TaxID=544730 RepID=A0A833VNJ0_9POAL|nr:E3 ubiquitin-protein ligase UPL6-like isoform X1 [Carex littledalei]